MNFFIKMCLYLLLLNFAKNILPISFIYPVAFNEINNLIYIINQKSINDLSLLLYNVETKTMQRVLSANYLPAGLKLLPDQSSFSFIDQGRLRIKSLQKRSAKTLQFYEPISDINIINWIDNECCYFSARQALHFSIFQAHAKNCSIKTILQKKADCLYPQKVNESLFYIERIINKEINNYKIIKTTYDQNDKQEQIIINNNVAGMAFLNFLSEEKGFYIEHQTTIDRNEKVIFFKYFLLTIEKSNCWQNKELFSFALPLKYIFGNKEERLYESILPFLPKIFNEKILFCSCDINKIKKNDLSINIYCFDLLNNNKKQLTNAKVNQIFFAPIILKNKIFYGTQYNNLIDNNIAIENIDSFPVCL